MVSEDCEIEDAASLSSHSRFAKFRICDLVAQVFACAGFYDSRSSVTHESSGNFTLGICAWRLGVASLRKCEASHRILFAFIR